MRFKDWDHIRVSHIQVDRVLPPGSDANLGSMIKEAAQLALQEMVSVHFKYNRRELSISPMRLIELLDMDQLGRVTISTYED